MSKLSKDFYRRTDTVQIAKDLIGKKLVSNINGILTSGRIVESEAYLFEDDVACHACKFGKTPRTEAMFANGGIGYVYTCYGIHQLFNVVTNVKDHGDAVLVRALEPIDGVDIMRSRRKKKLIDHTLTRGPGSLTVAMGIAKSHNEVNLCGNEIWIEDDGHQISLIKSGPRIGIEGAGPIAMAKPFRFYVKGNKWVSATRT